MNSLHPSKRAGWDEYMRQRRVPSPTKTPPKPPPGPYARYRERVPIDPRYFRQDD